MRKRAQKSYLTENSILKDIDANRQRYAELLAEANVLDKLADKLLAKAHPLAESNKEADNQHARELQHQAKSNRSEATKNRKTATRIEDITLPKLKRTLAAFRTDILPGVVSTKAVVLQK